MSAATAPAGGSSAPSFIFPVLSEDRDFVITNFLQDAEAKAAGNAEDFELPFGNIPRGERIGRIADWTGLSADAAQQRGGRRQAAITNTQSKAEEESEGWSFSLGHAAASMASTAAGRRPAPAKPVRGAAPSAPGARFGAPQKDGRAGGRPFRSWNRPVERVREPSIKVGQDWKLVEEIEFSRLAKVQINVEEPAILSSFGAVSVYDRANDKLRAKSEKIFTAVTSPVPPAVAASDDAFIKECAARGEAAIYTTDVVASLLMTYQRTVQPWDIVVKRRGQAVFFDVRPESRIHLVNVSENAGEAAPEDSSDTINSQHNLAMEASRINLGLPEFLGKGQETVRYEKPADASIGHAYRYAKFDLGDTFSMVVRSEVSNALGKDGQTVLARAFLEFDHAAFGWRSKLDTSRGAVLAHEIKHNGAMLSRWVYQALFTASATLKLAYVSRVNPKNATRHAILGVHDFDPYDLATQMSLNVANGFGVLRALADLCLSQPDNTDYALVRDANKPMLRLYSLPR